MSPNSVDYGWVKEDVLKSCWFESRQLSQSLLREKKKRKRKETDQVQGYESEVEEPAQKQLRRNSQTQTRQVDTCHESGLTTTTDSESDAFDDDDIDLNSLSGSHCVKSVRIWSSSGPYSVRMRKNTDQNNSEYRNSSRSI